MCNIMHAYYVHSLLKHSLMHVQNTCITFAKRPINWRITTLRRHGYQNLQHSYTQSSVPHSCHFFSFHHQKTLHRIMRNTTTSTNNSSDQQVPIVNCDASDQKRTNIVFQLGLPQDKTRLHFCWTRRNTSPSSIVEMLARSSHTDT